MFRHLVGGYIRPIKDEAGQMKANSVAELQKVSLGGLTQWIVVRGHDIHKPLLLFLHGGPGASQVGTQQKFLPELERLFVVVNWDQRGAGKSFSGEIPPETMHVNQLLEDTRELVSHLLKTYKRSKLYLVGHSSGAYLGILFAQRYPELLYGYIGINQPVDRKKEEALSYQYVLQKAEKVGNKKALKALRQIEFKEEGVYKDVRQLGKQRYWLTKFGGVSFAKNALHINIHCVLSSHLTWRERLRFFKGFEFSAEHLWTEFCECNLPKQIPELKVPVYFVVGRHDKIVHLLCVDYAEKLAAPEIKVLMFENSGHLACFEEPQKFMKLMEQIALSHNDEQHNPSIVEN